MNCSQREFSLNCIIVTDIRGMWIVYDVQLYIIDYLQNESSAIRALLFVHLDTPGGVNFFSWLGFKTIENAVFEGYYSKITKLFDKITKL